MAVSAKAIKSKISSVESVSKITKAMELVSISKMKKSVTRAEQVSPYATAALKILGDISADSKRDNLLLQHGDNKKNLVILISSNRGLCGSYNTRIAKSAADYVLRTERKHGSQCEFVCIGSYSKAAAQNLHRPIKASFEDFNQEPTLEDLSVLIQEVYELFETGEYWNVVVVFTDFISTLNSQVVAKQLLPVKLLNVVNLLDEEYRRAEESVKRDNNLISPEFEPSEIEVLDTVLRRLTNVQLFNALVRAAAAEHSARMVAMKNATENAGRLVDELRSTYNRARQAAITQEISEIASGAESLST